MNADLQALLDACVDAIVIIDHRGIIETFNRAACRIFGYTEDELIGRNVSVLMPDPDDQQHDQYLERYVQTREPHVIGIGRDVVAKRRDGSQFPAALSIGEITAVASRASSGFSMTSADAARRKNSAVPRRRRCASRASGSRTWRASRPWANWPRAWHMKSTSR